jgi:hypothetical protein
VSYNYSKTLSNTDVERGLDALLNNAQSSIEKARAPWDLTHSIKLNHYIPLPAGTGHRFNPKGMNWLLGDWVLSGFMVIQSGNPVSILSELGTLNRSARSGQNTVNTTDTQSQLDAISGLYMTGNGPYFINPSVIGPNGTGVAPFGQAPFSGEVFFNPNFGTVGDLQRRQLSGPWFKNYDMSVLKNFRITEHARVQFRADFYNLLNHPNFLTGDQNANSVDFGKITSMLYAADGVGPRITQFGLYLRY